MNGQDSSNSSTSEASKPAPSAGLNLADIQRPLLWAAIALVLTIIARSFVMGSWGVIGVDGDDVMRLVQIQDYLGGQSWFDTDQYRLGPHAGPNGGAAIAGTDMHWSRLVDVPIIVLTHLFDIFMPQDSALRLAVSFWPPMTAGLFVWAVMKAASYYASARVEGAIELPKTFAFSLALLAFFVIPFYRFQPGAIDHHNVQMGLTALAIAGGLDPRARFRTHFIAGAAAAISVAIGTEVYIVAAALCLYMGLSWIVKGRAFSRAAQGFGIGLAAGMSTAFFATIAPAEYGLVKCDSLSLITLCAAGAGGLGLALIAKFTRGGTLKHRLLAAAGLGAACLAIFVLQGPQCLANPLATIPEDVDRLWLGQVNEARPLWAVGSDWLEFIPLTLGPPLLALFILARQIKSDGAEAGQMWSPRVLLLFMLLASIALSVYQIRFNTFSYVISLIPLAAWVGGIYTRGKIAAESSETGSNVAYIGALALSVPLVWLLPAAVMQSKVSGGPHLNASAAQDCFSPKVMEALTALPKGTIAATSDGGVHILHKTPHRSLSGNYHRNLQGISAQIKLATSAPDAAYVILKSSGVDYVHFCKGSEEAASLIAENPKGLYGRLNAGAVPEFLSPIAAAGDAAIYQVK